MIRTALRRLARLPRWPQGGIVLLYHRVTELATDPHQLAVTPAHFAEHLAVIAERGVPMPLQTMVDLAQQDALPAGAVSVSFDDGYADNLWQAVPLLTAARVPATIFVSTGAADSGREFWWDEPDRVTVRDTHRPLTGNEVRELARVPGITIGSHTVTHPSLAPMPADDQRREVREARQRLQALTGTPVNAFAYPFGGEEDVSGCTETIVRDEGITIACTTEPGSVRRGVNPLRVPRVIVRDWSRAQFLEQWSSWTTGP